MKISCSNKNVLLFVLALLCFKTQKSFAQQDTLFIDTDFKHVNLKEFAGIYSSDKNQDLGQIYSHGMGNPKNGQDHFYFGFNDTFNYLGFTVKNRDSVTLNPIVEFSNALIRELVVYKMKDNAFVLVNKTGIAYPFRSRLTENRNFVVPMKLKGQESATYLIQLKKEKGKPLVTMANILNEGAFKKQSFFQYMAIGSYFGISILSVLFSLFAFYFLRNYSYLIYALYVVFLGLFISSYLGIFYQFFLDSKTLFNTFSHYVLFSEISLVLFTIFAQKVLNAKENVPRLKKLVDALIVALISMRFAIHFVFSEIFSEFIPFFMKAWYGFILITVLAIILEIIAFYRKNNKRTSLFAIAYLFMTSGAFITVLYHSYGLVNTYIYGLPIIFYSSALEILFLTFTIIYMVKEIYDDRNVLSEQLVHQQQKFLTAFIDGQEKERQRIGKELHDNIGSRLGHFKRLFSKKFASPELNEQLDTLCEDVRDLSHKITPSEIELVGLVGAVSDLTGSFTKDGQIVVDFNSYQFPQDINETIATNLYRIIQESLNNISKHSRASHVDVQLVGHENSITLTIEDNGKGFNKKKSSSGVGLRNIRSRVNQLKGNFLLDTALNQGTSILITIPIS